MAHGTATRLAIADNPSGPLRLSDLVLCARVELYACLQLLTDRARFITGATWAAIALHEGDDFIYCAAAGSSAPVIGSAADVKALRPGQPMAADGKSLVVAVIRESKTAGVFQLVSDRAAFSDDDLQSVVRLAEMVSTAIDHMDAEEHSIAEQSPVLMPAVTVNSLKPAPPVLWHAPDGLPPGASSKSSATSDIAVTVYACESCGFPVSRGRSICVDCEERGTPTAANIARLFSAREKEEESWLSAHGYTIASLLVSALVAAIVYWLR
jgi:hypothetical protein